MLSQTFMFTVGTLGNLGAWFTTGSQAPDVGMGLHYQIDCDGSIRIEFVGSFIPSHRFYIDWALCGDHDMLDNDSDKVDAFLSTGRRKVAPGDLLKDWKGKGRRC